MTEALMICIVMTMILLIAHNMISSLMCGFRMQMYKLNEMVLLFGTQKHDDHKNKFYLQNDFVAEAKPKPKLCTLFLLIP